MTHMTNDNNRVERQALPQVTLRSTISGIFIGSLILISNFQFGLQTGWVSMMSLPAALLGFIISKFANFTDFSDVENVYIQSLSVSIGTGPLAYGFIGIIPSIEKFLKAGENGYDSMIKFGLNDLIIWSFGLGFIGIFFGLILRKQMIIKENLKFPSGSATSTLISILNSSNNEYIHILIKSLSFSSFFTFISYFVPQLMNIPLFGSYLRDEFYWSLKLSPAYIGQGIIMKLQTCTYMMLGSICGWAILAPMVKFNNWSEDVHDWVIWISLSVMICDSLITFAALIITEILKGWRKHQNFKKSISNEENRSLLSDNNNVPYDTTTGSSTDVGDEEISVRDILKEENGAQQDVNDKYLVDGKTIVFGMIVSSVICVFSIQYVFDIVDSYLIIISIVMAFFLSILAVRSLGETDLNPVSGIGKISQFIISLIIPANHPGKLLINLITGAIVESGAQQSGDLIQDFKTGHLLKASPKCQFVAQLIGTVWSIFLSSVIYVIYNKIYKIPNDLFKIPTAIIWIDFARLINGEDLPSHVYEFSIGFAVIFSTISILKNYYGNVGYLKYLPNGIAFGIGLYNLPPFILARFIGGLVSHFWNDMDNITLIIFSSGLVLGEGVLSIINMIMENLGIPHF